MKSSFDDRGIRRLQENLSRVGGTSDVPITELLSPEFMSKHTDYPSFEAMLAASPFGLKTAADFKDLSDDEWETYVRKVTRFDSWFEMKKEASVAWLRGQLLRGVG